MSYSSDCVQINLVITRLQKYIHKYNQHLIMFTKYQVITHNFVFILSRKQGYVRKIKSPWRIK